MTSFHEIGDAGRYNERPGKLNLSFILCNGTDSFYIENVGLKQNRRTKSDGRKYTSPPVWISLAPQVLSAECYSIL